MVDTMDAIKQLHDMVYSNDSSARITGDVGTCFKMSRDIDWKAIGREKHYILSCVLSHFNDRKRDMIFPGVVTLWRSLMYYFGEYSIGENQSHVGEFKYQMGQNHVKWFIDFQVEASYTSINPESLVMVNEVMDWDLWGLRAGYFLKKKQITLQLWKPIENQDVTPGKGIHPSMFRPAGFLENEHFLILLDTPLDRVNSPKVLQVMFPLSTLHECKYTFYFDRKVKSGDGWILHNFMPSNNHPLFLSTLNELMVQKLKLNASQFLILSPSELLKIQWYDGYLDDLKGNLLDSKSHYKEIHDRLLEANNDGKK